ncbi:thioredoxin domain-containing protein [Angustibacter sp. Root456]|uniref:thioredoxin domain-containing protein n=1 Tax=Angustibacter sp. Root456 TaxID=1736539 RepID=UPI0006FFEEE6|nr:thioredoxin domain-containing protein [Angustibacter sp. Root456]KQX69404.1 N-acylglucosamine 2-epimerase [Angustibacter sp. Root456]
MVNRLANATSPYLLQHQDNPVDWWEWGEDAFAEARRRDVPVILSVGYAACHWCHVMARESFEDDATAALMNDGFVCVKVDREERPDVDAVYMEATVAMTGHGGWPMTVFLTPEGRVFHAGTYYPARPHPQMPSFTQLLGAVRQAWEGQRGDVEGAATRVAQALSARQRRGGTDTSSAPSASDLADAVRRLHADFDAERGGFGGAPKFPPSMVLEFLLRHAARVGDHEQTGAAALHMVTETLRHMAFSGMYDQLEGGFARYAVDADWVVPHFEKMLYDNALLARVYLHWWRLTGDPLGRRVAEETCDFIVRRLLTAEGGLSSALDADTPTGEGAHGVEGLTYVWTPQQLRKVLGPDDGPWVAQATGVTPEGTFEHGTSTLQLRLDVDSAGADPADVRRWQSARDRLRGARARRPQPARDDKVVAAWNGLAVAALAECGVLLGRADLLSVAERAADLLVREHVVGGRLRRVSRAGRVGAPAGVLEDHADVIEGLLALYSVTGAAHWVDAARPLVEAITSRFWTARSGFSDTASDASDPLLRNAAGDRGADPSDNAYPSGPSAAASALLTWAALTGDDTARLVAAQALDGVRQVSAASPRFAGWGLAAAEAAVDGPREVAVVGAPGDERTTALWLEALAGTAPGLVVAAGAPGAVPAVELLEGRGLVRGEPAAYPCRGQVCDLPTVDVRAVRAFVRCEDRDDRPSGRPSTPGGA